MISLQPLPSRTPGLRATAERDAATHEALLAALLDEIDSGLVVCDADGVIAYANHAARAELDAQGLLRQVDACLRLAGGVRAPLELALRQAATTDRRRLLLLTNDTDRLMLSVVPLPEDGRDVARVLVLLGRREPCSDLSLEMFGALHGLTLAERRVLRGLVGESTPREIADTNGVALSTVRSHIASIRTKLGVRSIESLLLRTAGLPPMAVALRRAGSRTAPEPLQALAA